MQNVANWAILDSFDIATQSGHNSLIQAPIEMIQDVWNAKTKPYNFHVLSFERYGLHQGQNWA